MFTKEFDNYVCEGDSITCTVDGLDCRATLYYDDDTTPPDKRQDGFWPSLDPNSDGYIGAKSRRTLVRHMAHAKEVMDTWRKDEWHYFGVAVTVSKNGVDLTGEYDHALWGIEGNYPQLYKRRGNPNRYLRQVANEYLSEALDAAKAKLELLCDCEEAA